ncbi:MAG: DNA polymerase III subunit alpha [Thermodesulfobacteriota bacterium]
MIPLTVRSGYSLMWGTSGVNALCRHAKDLGYEHLAVTDTDNLYGLWPFLAACRREGLRPIVGAEVTDRKTSSRAVCLVKNTRGYRNLCRLITRRHTDADFDVKSALVELSDGLVVLTGCPDLLFAGHTAGIDICAALPRRPLPGTHPVRKAAARLDIPLVATPGSFFLNPEDFATHRVLRAIDNNTALCRLKAGDSAPEDAFFAAPQTYQQRFAICPEAIENTYAVAERIDFDGPDFGLVMPPYEFGPPACAAAHLRAAAYEGAGKRYGEISTAVGERLEHELAIISEMGFPGYFLIVADIVAHSPRTCGRGSGAASLVAYCLGITNVCPVKHNLYFERFLNPGRSDPPDIDVDFAWDERDDVIASVLSKYGRRAALVANHVCFKPRMAVRETARVFGLTDREIGKVADRLSAFWRDCDDSGQGLHDRIAALPRMQGIDFAEPWPEIFAVAQHLIGLPRYLSVHPGGVVITPESIDAYVPVQTAPKGVPIVQWEKDAVEDAGLVKIDLLGNRSLGVIRDAVADIHENQIAFDERCWAPEDDCATRTSLAAGNTMGCFYIESPAMRLLQQKSGVGDFAHLVIHSSIIRPAANEVIQEYLRRLHGGAWEPIHPLTADVLGETFGLMVYQEDVSRVAVRIAGFSHAEADGLRKVMAKKDRSRHLPDYFERFAAGARDRGVNDADIERIWQMIMSFSGYSFCKPHSASYARVSFQAAYLKTHFPAEFMAAVISNQGGFYSTFAYVSEARRLGVTILPPDVEKSRIRWTGQQSFLRVGLLSIKDLSSSTRNRIIKTRQNACFTSAPDFFERVAPDDTEARALIHSGALDCFHPQQHRPALLWQYAAWRKKRRRQNIEPALFADPAPPAAPNLPEDDPTRRLRREFAVLGFLCDRHPMTLFEDRLTSLHTVKAADISKHLGRRIRFAGWLITGKTVATKKGDPMQFLTFEDDTGLVETTFFPQAHHRFCHILDYGRPFFLSGKVESNWGATTLTVDGVRAI